MRLIYVYFDFTRNGTQPYGYRGYQKCGFNFGTDVYCKMLEPSAGNPKYTLHVADRLESEQIEPGFWNIKSDTGVQVDTDNRLYNISALVGDNGAGKSTIIHEIIYSLQHVIQGSEAHHGNFALLMQDNKQKFYLYQTLTTEYTPQIIFDNPKKTEGDSNQLPIIQQVKCIYFSNALAMSDKTIFDKLTDPRADIYTQPFYDCSLTSDVINAVRISGEGTKSKSSEPQQTIRRKLDTYFRFRSYQEARYVFDRNQRRTLLGLKQDYGLPVPVPKMLNLRITSAIEQLRNQIANPQTNKHAVSQDVFETFQKQYSAYINEQLAEGADAASHAILAELCLNCTACFAALLLDAYGHSFPPRIPTSTDFGKPECYTAYLNALSSSVIKKTPNNRYRHYNFKKYLDTCKAYIKFLWNNEENVSLFFENIVRDNDPDSILRCRIRLDDNINLILEEFMIRFLSHTRAVSHWVYFVVYSWGLSSGESNLLHMFTKLRYLLDGPICDLHNPTDKITDKNAGQSQEQEHPDVITNNIRRELPLTCDSVILFVDEADLTLHPEWQRQFVSILTAFLPKLFRNPYYTNNNGDGCKDIQVILGTHSPIMLGDFPGASVIYLRKKDDGSITADDHSSLQTFGENIYTILNNGFYLQNGTIGELARRKMNDIFKDIHELQERIQKHEKDSGQPAPDPTEWSKKLDNHRKLTIQYLPDGIIKEQLTSAISRAKNSLDMLLSQEEKRAKQIQRLDEQINQLVQQREKLKQEGGCQ